MHIKNIAFILFLCFNTYLAKAQFSTAGTDFWNNVRFGGSIGLGFTNNGFNGFLSPSAIYQFNDQFAAGTSLSFNYAKFDDDKFLAYGGSVLALYNPIPQIQLSSEFEQLRVNRTLSTNRITLEDNYWLPALFIGIGYSTYTVTFGIRYDLLYDDDRSIYANAFLPFVRVYF